MQIGSYIRHFLYRYKGEKIYRYGIVINVINYPPPTLAAVFWQPTRDYIWKSASPYCEKIKIHRLELISEPR